MRCVVSFTQKRERERGREKERERERENNFALIICSCSLLSSAGLVLRSYDLVLAVLSSCDSKLVSSALGLFIPRQGEKREREGEIVLFSCFKRDRSLILHPEGERVSVGGASPLCLCCCRREARKREREREREAVQIRVSSTAGGVVGIRLCVSIRG